MILDVNTIKLSNSPSSNILYDEPAHICRQQHGKNQSPYSTDPEIFRLLVENSADGLALFENQKLVYASPSMNRIFGCADFNKLHTYAEVLKNVHPDDYSKIEKMYAAGMKDQLRHQTYTYRFKREDDSYNWIENSVTRFFDDQGKNFRNIVICRDITEKKNNEIELSHRNAILEAITDKDRKSVV